MELTGFVEGLFQFGIPATLVFDRLAYRFFAAGEGLFVGVLFLDTAQLDFIQRSRCFFSVAGDEGNRISFVEKGESSLYLLRTDAEGTGNFNNHRFVSHGFIPSIMNS